MPARTLAYRLLLVSPVLYLGAIGVRARVHIDPYVFTACTVKQQQAFLPYKDLCIKSAQFQGLALSDFDRADLRRVAAEWHKGVVSGALKPLTPVHLDDFTRDGIKQQIGRARDAVAIQLAAVAKDELKKGNRMKAVSDLVAAIRVSEAMKYSDPYSISHSGMMQRTALMKLEPITRDLTPAERLWLRSELRQIRDSQQPLEPITRLVARLYREVGTSNGGENGMNELDDLLRQPDSADKRSVMFLASLPKPRTPTDVHQSALVGLLRMSGSSQEAWLENLDHEISSLATPLALVAENPKGSHVASVSP